MRAVKRRSKTARTVRRSVLYVTRAASASSSESRCSRSRPGRLPPHEPRFQAMTGVPQAIASIITTPERLRPVDREQQCAGFTQKLRLLLVRHLADVVDHGWSRIAARYAFRSSRDRRCRPRRNFQRDAGAARDRDRDIGTLLRRDAADEREMPCCGRARNANLCAGRPWERSRAS